VEVEVEVEVDVDVDVEVEVEVAFEVKPLRRCRQSGRVSGQEMKLV
jgi:hypothetical protein